MPILDEVARYSLRRLPKVQHPAELAPRWHFPPRSPDDRDDDAAELRGHDDDEHDDNEDTVHLVVCPHHPGTPFPYSQAINFFLWWLVCHLPDLCKDLKV